MKNINRVNLYCLYYAQDDKDKNTAIKLQKHNLIKLFKSPRNFLKNAIILDPFASKTLSKDTDIMLAKKYGIVVIDGSWDKLEILFKDNQENFKNGRVLPNLLAANTINYGKWNKLSSAEALAVSLNFLGFTEQSHEILSVFKWGDEFWKINSSNL